MAQIQQQSLLEVIAVVLAVLYVVLAAKQHILCWPAAMVSTGIYVWIFWEVLLPFQAILNVFYFAVAIYGWRNWQKMSESDLDHIKTWQRRKHVSAFVILTGLSIAVIALTESWFESQYLNLDVVIAVFSCFATYLMAQKILENWLYWVVLNAGAIYLYFSQELLLTAVLFCFYLGYAFVGYHKWLKCYRRQVAL